MKKKFLSLSLIICLIMCSAYSSLIAVTTYQKGDVNLDGQISKEDGLLLAEHFLNNNLTEEDKELGDLNEDGIINIKDSQEIYLTVDPNFIIGDYNGDGKVATYDGFRILRMVTSEDEDLSLPEMVIRCDYNGDGKIALYDAFQFLKLTENLNYGDINRDGAINSIDASIVIDKYKSNTVHKDDLSRADMNRDNALNSTDASMIIDKYKSNEQT